MGQYFANQFFLVFSWFCRIYRIYRHLGKTPISDLQIGHKVQIGMKSVTMFELQIGDKAQTGMKSVTMSDLEIGHKVQAGVHNQEQCLTYI